MQFECKVCVWCTNMQYCMHTPTHPALKDALESRGVLGEVQAKLRAEVYKALDDQVHSV